MIKYFIKGSNTFAFDTVSENINKLDYVYLSDCWLIEEDGELTIFDRSGFKQKMQVVKGDVIIGVYMRDKAEYIVVKDANFTDIIRRKIQSDNKVIGECEDGKTAN